MRTAIDASTPCAETGPPHHLAKRTRSGERFADPLFILSPPRSFSSVVCAMLGQHPQMYGLPEVHLFEDETMRRWFGRSSKAQYPMADGLLRAIAQLMLGEQIEANIKVAAGWLKRRSHLTSGCIFEELARYVYPRILIEKSPSTVHSGDAMQRVLRFFPKARFIHLVRHPRSHGDSVMKYVETLATFGPVPNWLSYLAAFPYNSRSQSAPADDSLDPQRGWYVLNMNIITFLKSVHEEQRLTVRGEDLLAYPDHWLREIAAWLGLRTDAAVIEEMKHPERSPYACFGPPGARLGNDIFFLEHPGFHPRPAQQPSLEGPLEWRTDGGCFLPEVRELSLALGYT
jgi:Sulfotransferase family